jgi:hypothetical protein
VNFAAPRDPFADTFRAVQSKAIPHVRSIPASRIQLQQCSASNAAKEDFFTRICAIGSRKLLQWSETTVLLTGLAVSMLLCQISSHIGGSGG